MIPIVLWEVIEFWAYSNEGTKIIELTDLEKILKDFYQQKIPY